MTAMTSPTDLSTITRAGDRVVIDGHVHAANRHTLRTLALECVEQCEHDVLIDLRRAKYIDASGIATLMTIAHAAHAVGKSVVLIEPSAELCKYLEIAGLADAFSPREIA